MASSGVNLHDDAWHHVAAVLPPGSTDVDDFLLYIDGTLNVNINASEPLNTAAGSDVYIGRRQEDSIPKYSKTAWKSPMATGAAGSIVSRPDAYVMSPGAIAPDAVAERISLTPSIRFTIVTERLSSVVSLVSVRATSI